MGLSAHSDLQAQRTLQLGRLVNAAWLTDFATAVPREHSGCTQESLDLSDIQEDGVQVQANVLALEERS